MRLDLSKHWGNTGYGIGVSGLSASHDGTILALSLCCQVDDPAQVLWTMNADGRALQALTAPPDWALWPAISPDGDLIAYERESAGCFTRESCTLETVITRLDGTELRAFTTAVGPVAWSPSGTQLAVCDGDTITLVAPDGTYIRRLATVQPSPSQACQLAWSPDGSLLAFHQDREIWTIHVDGSGLRPITTGRLNGRPSEDLSPAWSPDGKTVAFLRGTIAFHVWLVNADGTGERLLYTRGKSDAWPGTLAWTAR